MIAAIKSTLGSAYRSELVIDKDIERLAAGEIGFSIEDGKAIMAHLQQLIVKQQCETYVLTSRFCMDCENFRRIKDYAKRNIRTVFGCVEVGNPRIMNCLRCLPHLRDAWTVLRDICPDQATPELMELSARLGSLMPYRKAAEVMAEFLPIKPTESFVTLRHRTLMLGKRLDENALQRDWFEPPSKAERRQTKLCLPNDPDREFVVSIDTAHVRASRAEAGRNFEIVVARCGRGGRGSRPGQLRVGAHVLRQGGLRSTAAIAESGDRHEALCRAGRIATGDFGVRSRRSGQGRVRRQGKIGPWRFDCIAPQASALCQSNRIRNGRNGELALA